MSEQSLDYAQMIEIPVNTCTVTYKKSKRKKRKTEDLKTRLLSRINAKAEEQEVLEEGAALDVQAQEITEPIAQPRAKKEKRVKANRPRQEKSGGINIVMLEFAVVCALCAVIFLTNIFVPDSGINTFLKNTFTASERSADDNRSYTDFTAALPVRAEGMTLEEGVMTFSGSSSLYAPCDGTLTNLTQDADGLYIMEVSHNSSFKTVISGATFAYYKVGDTVFSSLPVGYVDEGTARVYLYSDGNLVNNYALDAGGIVWQV